MDEDFTLATGETVEENVSTEDDGNEIHATTLLLERAPWDLAVEAFLVRVFLSLPRHLKACRRVCTSWNCFIKEQVGVQFNHLHTLLLHTEGLAPTKCSKKTAEVPCQKLVPGRSHPPV